MRPGRGQHHWIALLVSWLAVAAAYVTVSLVAYQIPFPSTLSPFWPGPAVGLAALVLVGPSILPGVMLGALTTALLTGAPTAIAGVIAAAATLEVLMIAWLSGLLAPRWWRFRQQRALSAFVVVTVIASGIAALLGCIGLKVFGALGGLTRENFAVWWIGDGVGILVVAPLLISLLRLPWRRWREFRLAELFVFCLLLATLGWIVFLGAIENAVLKTVLGLLIFPLMIWGAFRFELIGAALGMVVLTPIALVGTALGSGPFARSEVLESLLMLQGFVAVCTLSSLVLAVEVGQRRRTHQRLMESEERLDFALWGTDLGTWDWDLRTGKVVFNERWPQMLGYDPGEMKPDIEAWERQIHPEDVDRARDRLNAHLEGETPQFEVELRFRNAEGRWQWVLTRGKVVERDNEGRPLRAAGTHQDIDARKRQEEELAAANVELTRMQAERERLMQQLRQRSDEMERRAKEDHLTGLPNRRHFESVYENEWERARRFDRRLSIAMGDLDHFKQINDRHSHQFGDKVLKGIAQIFPKHLRRTDFVARYGGEEFVFLFPETPVEEATALCERLRAAVEGADWSWLDASLRITISFGIAGNDEARNPDDALAEADRRLYRAKAEGRNRVCGPKRRDGRAGDQPVTG